MTDAIAGDAGWWDSQASTLDAARFAVWSLPDDQWDTKTAECVDLICAHLGDGQTRILDVGCGIGRLTVPVALRYPAARLTGYDVADRMLDHARALSTEGVEWVLGNGRDVPPGPYTGAYSVVVLQHNPRSDCAALIRSVAGELAPGGRFVFQLVGDHDVEDEGHIPTRVAAAWCTDVGLRVVELIEGAVLGDWLWVVAERPA